jgi:iron-sulfur cluster assembly protein
MITLSPTAANEVKRMGSKQNSNLNFRLKIQIGGCFGLFYDMYFDNGTKEDLTFNSQGIQIVIDSQSLNYVNGLVVDYSEDLMGGGFRFHNPLTTASCSCGNSFAVN